MAAAAPPGATAVSEARGLIANRKDKLNDNIENHHFHRRPRSGSHAIDAPPEKGFRAWIDPELMKQWFVPAPWTIATVETDVRPGGSSLVVMRSPEGVEFPNRGVYLEVVKNHRLVFTDAYNQAWEPAEKPFMTMIVTFEEVDGKTSTRRGPGTGQKRIGRRTRRWAFMSAGRRVRSNSQPWWLESRRPPQSPRRLTMSQLSTPLLPRAFPKIVVFLVLIGLAAAAPRAYVLLVPPHAPRFACAADLDSGFAAHRLLTFIHIRPLSSSSLCRCSS